MNSDKSVHVVPDTKVVVDGFHLVGTIEADVWLLTHFHGDHYRNLCGETKLGDGKRIYCSEMTGALIVDLLGVDESLVEVLELEKPTRICADVVCTAIDANHCPGSVMFIFEVTVGGETKTYLHCGDARTTEKVQCPTLSRYCGRLDSVYLDTTYATYRKPIPSREKAVEEAKGVVLEYLERGERPLVFVGSYLLGKELVARGVFEALQTKYPDVQVVLGNRRYRSLKAVAEHGDYERFGKLFEASRPSDAKGLDVEDMEETEEETPKTDTEGLESSDPPLKIEKQPYEMRISGMNIAGKMWPYFQPNFRSMEIQLAIVNRDLDEAEKYTCALGIVPTGWAAGSKKSFFSDPTNKFAAKLVPYSEHSARQELIDFIKYLKPARVIPTVYNSPKHQETIISIFHTFLNRSRAMRSAISSMFKAPPTQKTPQSQKTDLIVPSIGSKRPLPPSTPPNKPHTSKKPHRDIRNFFQ